ncbi:MAG: hypothetical protein CTY28_13045 [Hyphomicrobium sp.]|nr:MAG: hypothetical protein CTY28_13045 [Hyphomicrobium sp.]
MSTPAERLDELKAAWLAGSDEEEFYFEAFSHPKLLRRSKSVTGALTQLEFGKYQNFRQEWIDDDRVVWLGMIVSDQAGAGTELLKKLTKQLARCGVSLIGTPTPLKPRDWAPDRPFEYRADKLIDWYRKLGFQVLPNGSEMRVVHLGMASRLEVEFSFRQ